MVVVVSKLVIVGAGETAEIAYEYFLHDSPYEPVAFAVENRYRKTEEQFGLPVIDLESMTERYPPENFTAYVAVSYTFLNRVRRRLFLMVKEAGYTCASYISSNAFVWPNAAIGENCFVFENNSIQHHASIADNTTVWSGSVIAHRAEIGAHSFIASGAVINGFCRVGESCFFGARACLGDTLSIAEDSIIGMGAAVIRSIETPGGVYVGNPARRLKDSSYVAFSVPEELQ